MPQMGKKQILGLIAMAAAMLGNNPLHNSSRSEFVESETKEQREKRMQKAQIQRNKKRGLKEFFYGNKSLWALNQKSADKKAKKLNLLN